MNPPAISAVERFIKDTMCEGNLKKPACHGGRPVEGHHGDMQRHAEMCKAVHSCRATSQQVSLTQIALGNLADHGIGRVVDIAQVIFDHLTKQQVRADRVKAIILL